MHGLAQSALLKALGWSLFNSLWQMSLLWAIYHLFVLIFRESTARARHGLASALLSIGAGWTMLTFITTYWLGPATGSFLAPGPLPIYGSHFLAASRWFIDEGLSLCSFGYLLVLGGLLFHYTGHYVRSRRITRRGLSKIGPGFRLFVIDTARTMGIGPAVKVHLSTLVEVPVTLGFLKPVILLPAAMITQLSTQQVEAILVHELAHILRKDYLINLLITVMELLFFFNPFARMLIGQLKMEREHCCDDLVLQFRYDPHAYVSALLSLARHHRQGRLAVAATGGGSDQLLLQRARKILRQQQKDDRPGVRPLFLLLLTMGLTLFFWGPRTTATATQPAPAARIRPARELRPSFETDQRPIVDGLASAGLPHTIAPATVNQRLASAAEHRGAAHHQAAVIPDNDVAYEYGYNIPEPTRTSGPVNTPAPAYAEMVIVEDRDYSIATPSINGRPAVIPPATSEGFPFVPQSSFSFQSTDTLPPEDRLAMMEKVTTDAIRVRMDQLRNDLKTRLNALQEAQEVLARTSRNRTLNTDLQSASRKRLNRLLHDQLLLQHQYLIRLDSLQRQFQQAVRRLTTVYI